MVRIVRTAGAQVVHVRERDEQALGWFGIVRVSNVQAVRWVLGALNGWDGPVSARRAQLWCSRMEAAGLIGRAQMGGPGGAVVWGTYAGVGRARPDVFRQTTRHEVAVSTASARYATAGYAWQRDERAATAADHQADGIALGPAWMELVEVELTAKRLPRYVAIFRAYRRRLEREGSQVTYLCTPGAARAVRAALTELRDGQAIAPRVQVQEVFDRDGWWPGERLPEWLVPVEQRAAMAATAGKG